MFKYMLTNLKFMRYDYENALTLSNLIYIKKIRDTNFQKFLLLDLLGILKYFERFYGPELIESINFVII